MSSLPFPTAAPQGDLFRLAVAAIDAGDLPALRRLLEEHPALATRRLAAPDEWLRAQVGDALDGFFRDPWLLWFVAEDPIRNNRLPENIVEVLELLIGAVRAHAPHTLQEQIDGALRLTSWSPVASRCGVQLEMMEVLAAAGAKPTESPDQALVNRNLAAAERLVAWGAPLTLGTALCLERWDDLPQLITAADDASRQFALVLAALNGCAEGVRRLVALGVPVSSPSAHLYSHATPLHHAVSSGSLATVRELTTAHADLNARDGAWHSTPLEWAQYYASTVAPERRETYLRIVEHLAGPRA